MPALLVAACPRASTINRGSNSRSCRSGRSVAAPGTATSTRSRRWASARISAHTEAEAPVVYYENARMGDMNYSSPNYSGAPRGRCATRLSGQIRAQAFLQAVRRE